MERGCIRDRFSDLCKGKIYSALVLLQLIVGKKGVARIARALLCGDADSIRLAAHRRGLTAEPALLQIVAEEEYLVGIRMNAFACDEPHTLDHALSIHIPPEGDGPPPEARMRSSCRPIRDGPFGEGLF